MLLNTLNSTLSISAVIKVSYSTCRDVLCVHVPTLHHHCLIQAVLLIESHDRILNCKQIICGAVIKGHLVLPKVFSVLICSRVYNVRQWPFEPLSGADAAVVAQSHCGTMWDGDPCCSAGSGHTYRWRLILETPPPPLPLSLSLALK